MNNMDIYIYIYRYIVGVLEEGIYRKSLLRLWRTLVWGGARTKENSLMTRILKCT